MIRHKLAIWGASGHASVVADIVRLTKEYTLIGFLDSVNKHKAHTTFAGRPVFGGEDQLDALRKKGVTHIILGFGDCAARLRLAAVVRQKGFSLARAVHPKAVVADSAQIGEGTVVAAGAVINAGAVIGRNAIINTCASVDHDCLVSDGAHICPGVHLGGWVKVGKAAWIGIGSVVIDRIRIGDHALVGAGAVVVDDVPEKVVTYGVPARVKKTRI